MIDRPCWRGLLGSMAAVMTLLAVGCRGANSLYPVHGTVFLDDQPATELAGGTVVFNSPELHRSASGSIQADGSYQLGSLTKDDGALPGTYQVTVSAPETAAVGERGGHRSAAKPVAFEPPKNLVVTVEPKSNEIPIRLHRHSPAGH